MLVRVLEIERSQLDTKKLVVQEGESIQQTSTGSSERGRESQYYQLSGVSSPIWRPHAGHGGIRKLRWSAQGKDNSGGVRVVYYYHNGTMELFINCIRVR
tara:strand:+ start:129 stop:428 length:300 start_codon:yes stop_codon:yes gene_type:complete